MSHLHSESQIRAAFAALDVNGSGALDRAEFFSVLTDQAGGSSRLSDDEALCSGPASLDSIQLHGPAAELDKVKLDKVEQAERFEIESGLSRMEREIGGAQLSSTADHVVSTGAIIKTLEVPDARYAPPAEFCWMKGRPRLCTIPWTTARRRRP